MKAIPGHQIQLSVAQVRPSAPVVIALECSCGAVLHRGEFVVDDARHREHIREEGHDRTLLHLKEHDKKQREDFYGVEMPDQL